MRGLGDSLDWSREYTRTDKPPATAIVDKGFRGVEIEGVRILRSRQRRSAIKPAIGYMKMDGRLGRNSLKGALGDALHAVMCGAGRNLHLSWTRYGFYAPASGCRRRRSLLR